MTATVADGAPDPESVIAWRSEQRRLLDHLDALDADLRRMAELMLVGDMQETADLSRALAIPAAEVANRRKRLKRAVQAYLTEYRERAHATMPPAICWPGSCDEAALEIRTAR